MPVRLRTRSARMRGMKGFAQARDLTVGARTPSMGEISTTRTNDRPRGKAEAFKAKPPPPEKPASTSRERVSDVAELSRERQIELQRIKRKPLREDLGHDHQGKIHLRTGWVYALRHAFDLSWLR